MNEVFLPFLGTEAMAGGLVTRRALASRHDMIYRNVYLPKGVKLTPQRRAVAAWLWSGRNATIGGMSAAALHGSGWIEPELPAELRSVPKDRRDEAVQKKIAERETIRKKLETLNLERAQFIQAKESRDKEMCAPSASRCAPPPILVPGFARGFTLTHAFPFGKPIILANAYVAHRSSISLIHE